MSPERPVPHNRWDLLPDADPDPSLRVSVVVAHYEQTRPLQRVLHALAGQRLRPAEIVVADDGSRVLPDVADLPVPTRVVTQPDLGFRAAAARNNAARTCTGDVLVFLDADTTPERGFLAALTARAAGCRDALVVGRRGHAELSHLPVDADPASGVRLDEPGWLRAGYRQTRNLLDADGRSFRFVISAVMACRRALFEELGGFDERFVGYGGEDWDFAYRAWNAGAVLIHEPTAVAWHDGADWAARVAPGSTHDRQSMRLAGLIPEPSVRGVALPGTIPDVLVDVDAGSDPSSTVRCVHAVLRQGFRDLRVRLTPPVDPAVSELYAGTAQSSPWTADQLRRARARLTVRRPLPEHALGRAMGLLVADDLGRVDILTAGARAATLISTRAESRTRRWCDLFSPGPLLAELFGTREIDVGPPPAARRDLAGYFMLPGVPAR